MADKIDGDVFDRQQAESFLYPAKGLPGGGQLEVRMEVSPDHPDPDIRGVARRVKFFNLESWHKEWTEVAQKNQDLAAGPFFGIAAVVFLPVTYGVMGFVMTLIMAALYNALAKLVGGVEIDLR